MFLFKTIQEVKNCLLKLKNEGRTIGFVPTMGALHRGHIALLERAKKENDIVTSSIFVNPLQFNDKKDLEKYPRTLDKDSEMLRSAHCDVVFAPSTNEMYHPSPNPSPKGDGNKAFAELNLALGTLDKVMEGTHRPGHFQGVCVVVKKLFDIIEPNKAYFGEKDFQQLAIIKHMVKVLNLPVQIISCPTVREADGLAMSSRNTLLTTDERKNAPLIFRTLTEVKKKWKDGRTEGWKDVVEKTINANPFLKLEYFEVVNSETLLPVSSWAETKGLRACIAVKAGSVRLIDNIAF